MKFQNFAKISLLATATLFSCSSDDDVTDPIDPTAGLVRAEGNANLFVYSFENEAGESTVNFGGQTTRLLQGEELLSRLRTFGSTEAELDLMYTGQLNDEGSGLESAGFENEALNGTSRLLRGKTAASESYFANNSSESNIIRTDFDNLIAAEVETFLSQYESADEVPDATPGVAGAILDGIGENASIRLINPQGLENNQAFNKGLIGAIMADQIINHYLFLAQDEQGREDNANGVLDGDNPYTAIAHDWDEAYGYAFGNAANNNGNDDSFLYKYIDRVDGDADFAGIKEDIQLAFIAGRQAIVDVDYDEVDRQIAILQELISEVIAIRAVFYLQTGQDQLAEEDTIGGGFHDLSEGFGFVTSLRYTRDANGQPYFTLAEVNQFTDDLLEGNGFWRSVDELEDTTTQTTLDRISDEIAARFDFTVEQAGSLLSVE